MSAAFTSIRNTQLLIKSVFQSLWLSKNLVVSENLKYFLNEYMLNLSVFAAEASTHACLWKLPF